MSRELAKTYDPQENSDKEADTCYNHGSDDDCCNIHIFRLLKLILRIRKTQLPSDQR